MMRSVGMFSHDLCLPVRKLHVACMITMDFCLLNASSNGFSRYREMTVFSKYLPAWRKSMDSG